MRVPFHQTKKGLPAACWRLMNSVAAATVSSSIVSIRFFVRGPVSSIVCPPLPSARVWRTPRGLVVFRNSGSVGQSSFSGSSSALRW